MNLMQRRWQWYRCLKVYNHYSGGLLGYIGCLTEHNLILISHWPLFLGQDYQIRLFSENGGFKIVAQCKGSVHDSDMNSYDSNLLLPKANKQVLRLRDRLTESLIFSPLLPKKDQ